MKMLPHNVYAIHTWPTSQTMTTSHSQFANELMSNVNVIGAFIIIVLQLNWYGLQSGCDVTA